MKCKVACVWWKFDFIRDIYFALLKDNLFFIFYFLWYNRKYNNICNCYLQIVHFLLTISYIEDNFVCPSKKSECISTLHCWRTIFFIFFFCDRTGNMCNCYLQIVHFLLIIRFNEDNFVKSFETKWVHFIFVPVFQLRTHRSVVFRAGDVPAFGPQFDQETDEFFALTTEDVKRLHSEQRKKL